MKKAKYRRDLPHRMYGFFIGYDGVGVPSFDKFARTERLTLEDLREFRRHKEFDRAYRECSEIRRDYLIDNALSKKQDASITKFILSAEFGMGDDRDTGVTEPLTVTVEVIGDDN